MESEAERQKERTETHKEREKKRDRKSSYLLVRSPNAHNYPVEQEERQELGNQFRTLPWVLGTPTTCPIMADFQGPITRKLELGVELTLESRQWCETWVSQSV